MLKECKKSWSNLLFHRQEGKYVISKIFQLQNFQRPQESDRVKWSIRCFLLPRTEHRTPCSCLQLGAAGGVQVLTSTHQHPPASQGSPASYRIPVSCKGKTCTPKHSRRRLQHGKPHLVLLKAPESRISLPILVSRHQVSTTWVYPAKQGSSDWQIQAEFE